MEQTLIPSSVSQIAPEVTKNETKTTTRRPRAQSSVLPKNQKLELDMVNMAPDTDTKQEAITQMKTIEKKLSDSRLPKSPTSSSLNSNSNRSSINYKISILPDASSFAYFRKTDSRARIQRQMLFALHVRQQEIKGNYSQDDTPMNSVNPNSKGSSVFGKLNSLLKPRKKQRTRTGILHEASMAVQDRRVEHACELVNDLSSNSLRKKRFQEANRVFLKAMANRLDAVCLAFLEKGFPENINCHINGSLKSESDKPPLPTYFLLSIALGLESVFKSMLKMKPQVNYSWNQVTPLLVAAWKGNLTIVQNLIELGANTNRKLLLTDYFLLRRFNTSKEAKPEPVPLIALDTTRKVSSGLCADFKKHYDHDGQVRFDRVYSDGKFLLPFEQAAMSNHREVAKLLLSKTDVALVSSSQFSFLVQQDFEITCLLLKMGASIYQKDPIGCSPIHLVARQGSLDLVILFILADPNCINIIGYNGWTPLHEAVSYGHESIVSYLLYKGADRTIKNTKNETPHDLAKRIGEIPADSQDISAKEDLVKSKIENISNTSEKPTEVEAPKKRQQSTGKFNFFRKSAESREKDEDKSSGREGRSAAFASERRNSLIFGKR